MSLPEVVSCEKWLDARRDLLVKEKQLTRARDALCAERRRLPMVLIDKDYRFEGGSSRGVQLPLAGGIPPPRQRVRAGRGVSGTQQLLRDGDLVYHTYSVYARGLETIAGSYDLLDETALGRQEEWEEPRGRAASARAGRPDFAF